MAELDGLASPWHTVCERTAPDKPGLPHVIATAFAAAGAEVVAASANVSDGVAYDRFELVHGDGHKLTHDVEERIGTFLRSGVSTRRGWFAAAAATSRRWSRELVGPPSLR